ncbi:MAG: protein kinase [Pseudomonadota bacterium]
MPGRQFGPYRLVHQIATGGMAEVHLARVRGVGGFEKYVALKMIHPNFSSDERFVQMLIDEAKISVQLQHTNIAQIFDLGRVGDTWYLTMEFVDGCDLYRILRKVSERDRAIPIDVALFIAKEVLSGLDYAHRKSDSSGKPLGIIHRDISPQNVLISHAAEVKIVDFGIAKASMRARQTAAGVIKGKYYYMSPEQAWGDPLDNRTDVFSCGILLYEMLAGQMLYLEEDLHRLLDMVRRADIQPVSVKRPDCPRKLEQIVMKALAKKPDHRWQTAHELGSALESFLNTSFPEFAPSRLGALMKEIADWSTNSGNSGNSGNRSEEDSPIESSEPRVTRGLVQGALLSRGEFTDTNSVIFRLADVGVGARRHSGDETVRPARAVQLAKGRGMRAVRIPSKTAAQKKPGSRQSDGRASHVSTSAIRIAAEDRTRPAGKRSLLDGYDEDESTVVSATPSFEDVGDEEDEEGSPADEIFGSLPSVAERRETNEYLDEFVHSGEITIGPRSKAQPIADDDLEDQETEQRREARARAREGDATSVDTNAPPPLDDDLTTQQTMVERHVASRGVSVAPSVHPALSAKNPRPAVSALTKPRPSRRTPLMGLLSVPENAPSWAIPAKANSDGASIPIFSDGADSADPGHGAAAEDGKGGAPVPSTDMAAAPQSSPAPAPDWPASSGAPANAQPDLPLGDGFSSSGLANPTGSTGAGSLLGNEPPCLVTDQLKTSSGKRALLVLGSIVLGAAILALYRDINPGETRPAVSAVEVISIPPGGDVTIDGKHVGLAPIAMSGIEPGSSIRLRVEMAKHERWERQETISTQGGKTTVVAMLKPIVATLVVESRPAGADVLINNIPSGTTPFTKVDVDPFVPTTVEVRLSGYKAERRELVWREKRTDRIDIVLIPAKRRSPQ